MAVPAATWAATAGPPASGRPLNGLPGNNADSTGAGADGVSGAAGGHSGGGGGGWTPIGRGGGGSGGSGGSDNGESGDGGGGGAGSSYPTTASVTSGTGDPRVVISWDEARPQTMLMDYPRPWLLGGKARFAYASSHPDTSFACAVDGRPLECGADGVRLPVGKPGSHVFSVAATEPTWGIPDTTPAKAVWTVPHDDRVFKRSRGWVRKQVARGYRGSALTARRKGATLTYQVRGARELVLVASTSGRSGTVVVRLGNRVLQRVSLDLGHPRTTHRQLFRLGRWKKARSGRLTITTTSRQPVTIDGIGVRTR
ncbi:hypothetical protein [Nocardioides sp. TF02-7]|uniref:hypothetical protein n=1 Tax=Nocardioides sp. TF02-7 TaxID=2917724 RepID=UPI001F055799|nr:hypothetical protein [Nocardioides sp. TF02-7]UMG92130.1 hypothetical protein MF408_19625 [Nocardioides sp. TF02-7]